MNRTQRRANSRGVHHLVAETAKELAGTYYEILAHNDQFYKDWPVMRVYIAKRWRAYVQKARECLVDCLTDPGTHDDLKAEIMEGLERDGALNPPIEHAQAAAAQASAMKTLSATTLQ